MDNIYKKYFQKIINRYNKGTATGEEVEFLESYDNIFDLKDDLITDDNESHFQDIKLSIKKTVDQKIDSYEKKHSGSLKSFLRYAAAVLVILSVTGAGYFLMRRGNREQRSERIARNIYPGGNKAVLILAGGAHVILDSVHTGQVAKQANISITKTAGNQIVYSRSGGVDSSTAYQQQNTILTPNGSQYRLVLPDGTRVILNAASSLTYPAEFHGSERMVQLNGEAYFEVAENKKMPFRVIAGSQTVEVLGTHFNINAYRDEPLVKTTLLEGSVKVFSGSDAMLIAPGEQAVTKSGVNGGIVKHFVDVDQVTAWKNGFFSFNGDNLESVMRRVARWYDIKVVYDGSLSGQRYFGEISRASSLYDVFKILELNGVQFEMQDRTVTVSAKKLTN